MLPFGKLLVNNNNQKTPKNQKKERKKGKWQKPKC